MLISEMIRDLADIVAKHGDMPVYSWPYFGQAEMADPVINVDVLDGSHHLRIDADPDWLPTPSITDQLLGWDFLNVHYDLDVSPHLDLAQQVYEKRRQAWARES